MKTEGISVVYPVLIEQSRYFVLTRSGLASETKIYLRDFGHDPVWTLDIERAKKYTNYIDLMSVKWQLLKKNIKDIRVEKCYPSLEGVTTE